MVILSGCGTLRPDGSPSAISSYYPTADITCNGKHFNGLAFCASPAHIEIQGYASGSVRLDSERCQLGRSVVYANSAPVELDVSPTDSCLVDITVASDLISSVVGRVYIKTTKGNSYDTFIDKVPEGTDRALVLPARTTSRVLLEGCGVHLDQMLSPTDGAIAIHLKDLMLSRKDCLFEGAVVDGTSIRRFGWQLWVYSKNFNPLPEPLVTVANSKITITGSQEVSIITWDRKFILDSKATFVNDGAPHTVRLITSKGRLLIGEWDGKAFKWIP